MRALTPQTKTVPQVTPASPAAPARTLAGRRSKDVPSPHAGRSLVNGGARLTPAARAGRGSAAERIASFGHDFSRVPVSARRQSPTATGEMLQGAPGEMQVAVPITGDGGAPGGAVAPAPAAPAGPGTTAPAPLPATVTTPLLRKSQVGSISTANNGEFSWAVRWSIQNATAATDGWIVQHVDVKQTVTDSAGAAVTTGQGSYGGLRTSWYPLWEAWQVRGGSVFVGGSTTPHNADTYGQNAVGASTKGTTEIKGRADFYPGLTLPPSFTVRNAAPAWALPVTNTNPNLTGGTAALDHNLTATWDGVGGTGTTTVTTV